MLQLMQLSLIFEALSNGHDDGDLTIKEACDAAGINIMFFGWLICVGVCNNLTSAQWQVEVIAAVIA